ncbi:type-F conjugative transfer system secretin TraK [Novosphingobium sp. BK486]|uniref:type-F conjugative transfer system secretin TraK n=1 Tax=unclassified Novosphingobium TaxID=2644732 RepID=UPI00182F7A25|nr:conjugal transfer pilus assembly protein TraK [Novosphingobium sp. BK256]MBB3373415.1 conjugal transfer pilus assembly protein TraK [Novosphingobium sp. BK280]MBB3377784.1 conjugal transfer pilus assembly protein TraK [Novosphingobium sp. BK258]MBB3418805.1 conjugal transfer pilus assembly protein TraK [Novosphingobium sp. BK267]MBB3450360.1 conjugal transfer pilus assembly protein TraK [Novosphingobium sp. BK352]MBB3476700.1 conjugal transfer pilus assembly protein TraK [Novosphingobium sp
MPISDNRARLACLAGALIASVPAAPPALAQAITALPDQTSRIRLSNRDVNHVVCMGGDIEDVKFSAEKGLAVERGGSDAWIKFLVLETEDPGAAGGAAKTRTYVTTPSEFFVSCNGAIYPLYAEPADIPAQTVTLVPGGAQRARANDALLGPLVEEERAVGIALAILQDRVPASFSEVAPSRERVVLADLPTASLTERRHLEVEGAGLSVSEYLVRASAAITLDERDFLDTALGADIFAVTIDRLTLGPDETARLIVVRRSVQS